MKDANEIYAFCNKLAALWTRCPTLRFGQVLYLLDDLDADPFDDLDADPYYWSDEQWLQAMERVKKFEFMNQKENRDV